MLGYGEVLDRFEVVELLGQGGIAEVYKVRHRVLGSTHALKVVTAGGDAIARRLLREGSIQAQLRHPNVVAVTDVLDVRGHAALVLEYIEGVTLQGYLRERGPLPVDDALALFAQLLAGVGAAHAAGVLHRDLKPVNVMLTPGPTGVMVKVADFGLAKVVVGESQAGDTVQGLVMGTPGYMAPEQVGDAGGADARADVFALGVILYEMLAGASPFEHDDIGATLRATVAGKHVPLAEACPVPEAVAQAVERCLSVDRAGRYADARELSRALFGERPELLEVVEGLRAATPLSISLPSVVPMRPAGLSTAPRAVNPTLGPGTFADVGPAPTIVHQSVSTPEPPPPPRTTVRPPSRAPWIGGGVLLMGLLGAALVWPAMNRSAPAPEASPPPAIQASKSDAPPSTEVAAAAPAPVTAATGGAMPDDKAGGGAVGGAPPAPMASRAEPAVAAKGSVLSAPGAADVLTPEPEAPAAAAPAPVVADAAPVDEPAPVAEVAAAAPESSALTSTSMMAPLAGTWRGTWSGRPFSLVFDGGNAVRARLEVLVGTSYRSFDLVGTLDPATGRFVLAERAAPGWWVEGVLSGNVLTGSIRRPDQKKAVAYRATRE